MTEASGTGAHPSFPTIGNLVAVPALDRPDLLGGPVEQALRSWPYRDRVGVVEIDPELADTSATIEVYGVPPEASANCVVVAGKRAGAERIAACVVRADTRADVNSLVKRMLDVRKASFLPMDRAVAETSMEYGGITPIGLPEGWRLLIDERVPKIPVAMIGSGVRRSKLLLSGADLARIPNVEVVGGLGLR